MANKNSPEEEYFARIEAEKRERLARQLDNERAREEADALKAAHYMHCGKCGQKMMTTVFKGVEIEVCPGCGAVLLDPGELEQLAGDDQSSLFHNLAELFGMSEDQEAP